MASRTISQQDVQAVAPVAWSGAVIRKRDWLPPERLKNVFREGVLTVVAPVGGPRPATHLIRHRHGERDVFYLATLRSYRYVVELHDPLVLRPKPGRDYLFYRYEIDDDTCSPLREDVAKCLEMYSYDPGGKHGKWGDEWSVPPLKTVDPKELRVNRRPQRGAVASYILTRPSPRVGKRSDLMTDKDWYRYPGRSHWVVHVFERPYRGGRGGRDKTTRCRTPWRRQAWSSSWDGGGMGSNGTNVILEVDGGFFYASPEEAATLGPYSNLWDVIESDGLNGAYVIESIDCPGHTAAEIASHLSTEGARPGKTLDINGEIWECDDQGKLRLATEAL